MPNPRSMRPSRRSTVINRRIPDTRLAEMAREREEMKAKLASLNKDLLKLDEKILKEMERRNTRIIESDGVRITYVQAERTVYDWEGLKPRLRPAQRVLCVKEVFDQRGLAAAVQEGQIDIALVSEFSEVKKNAPYINVSEVA
jgi:hypothetical protein